MMLVKKYHAVVLTGLDENRPHVHSVDIITASQRVIDNISIFLIYSEPEIELRDRLLSVDKKCVE